MCTRPIEMDVEKWTAFLLSNNKCMIIQRNWLHLIVHVIKHKLWFSWGYQAIHNQVLHIKCFDCAIKPAWQWIYILMVLDEYFLMMNLLRSASLGVCSWWFTIWRQFFLQNGAGQTCKPRCLVQWIWASTEPEGADGECEGRVLTTCVRN